MVDDRRRSFTLTLPCAPSILRKGSAKSNSGRLAQLARAPARHAGGHRFKSCSAQSTQIPSRTQVRRTCQRLAERPKTQKNAESFRAGKREKSLCLTAGLAFLPIAARKFKVATMAACPCLTACAGAAMYFSESLGQKKAGPNMPG